MIGNAVEVQEAIETLNNRGPKSFMQLIEVLAKQVLLTAEEGNITEDEAALKVKQVLTNGKALEKFVEMVKIQGGNAEMIESPSRLPQAEKKHLIEAWQDGFISEIHCEEIGLGAMMLGAGRETKDSIIDMGVGLKLVKHVGDKVNKGETIAEVYLNPNQNTEKAIERLKNAISLSSEKITPKELILDIIT
jgi:pyrimidine-nucleoside phosphorylase